MLLPNFYADGQTTLPDSRVDTYQHIAHVRGYLNKVIRDLMSRAHRHDNSKLRPPEVELFDAHSWRLKEMEYDSPEYHASLKALGPALEHHYAHNDHHPQHFVEGIGDMNLMQVTEMLCDWLAAVKRMEHGDIYASIEANQKRFGYSDDFKQLLVNTVPYLELDSEG